ncbi:MAG TPA: hypothetical protein VJ764_02045 [Steroidobacteraceae bacterium]|nr:hypothetical protein [Steroidobacteraceae bacterium]
MREFTLILTDLYFDRHPSGEPPDWPRLRALEALLARGTVVASREWRAWVCQRIELPTPPRIPIAAITRSACPPPVHATPARHWWLAQGVHLEAGVDRVYLATEAPTLSGGEWRELERGFNAHFSTAGFRLVDGLDTQAYLVSGADLDADTTDPARVRGVDILQALPRGADGAALKRLMTEIQMWLHDHPVNIARAERGAVAVNGLWLWGGGQWPLEPPATTLPVLFSDDGFLRGLWQMGGAEVAPVPQSFEAIDLTQADATIVALASASAAPESAAQALLDLERNWFQPALAGLQRGRLGRLHVHINDRLLSLTRTRSWRWWRRTGPWFERLA